MNLTNDEVARLGGRTIEEWKEDCEAFYKEMVFLSNLNERMQKYIGGLEDIIFCNEQQRNMKKIIINK